MSTQPKTVVCAVVAGGWLAPVPNAMSVGIVCTPPVTLATSAMAGMPMAAHAPRFKARTKVTFQASTMAMPACSHGGLVR